MILPMILVVVGLIVMLIIAIPLFNVMSNQMANIDCTNYPSDGWKSACNNAKQISNNIWILIAIVPIFAFIFIIGSFTRGHSDDDINYTPKIIDLDSIKIPPPSYNEKIDEQFMGD
jgi:hypothetical protein